MNRNDWRMTFCAGKEAFTSWSLANQVLRERSRAKAKNHARQVYKCEFCGAFHLGTPGQPRRDKRKF